MAMSFKSLPDEVNDFAVTVVIGESCEAKVAKEFKPVFSPILSKIYYKKNPALQRLGCDGFIQFQEVPYEIKCRRFRDFSYVGKDILIEVVSVVEQNKPGWIYYTQSPVIIYLWLNIGMTGFLDGYILYTEEVKKFFIGNEDKYHKPRDAVSYRNGVVWHTANRIVPINDFPVGSIQHISKDAFTPKEQLVLSKFFLDF